MGVTIDYNIINKDEVAYYRLLRQNKEKESNMPCIEMSDDMIRQQNKDMLTWGQLKEIMEDKGVTDDDKVLITSDFADCLWEPSVKTRRTVKADPCKPNDYIFTTKSDETAVEVVEVVVME